MSTTNDSSVPIIDRQTQSGKRLTVCIELADARLRYVARVDGEETGSQSAEFGDIFDPRRTKMKVPSGTTGMIGPVCLYHNEPDVLRDAAKVAVASKSSGLKTKLEAAVPGITALRAAYRAMQADEDREQHAFRRMMGDGDNDGARPPKPIDQSLRAEYERLLAENPRAALYLKCERQDEGAHWSDNTGAGAAGRKAKAILEAGGSEEEATAALAERREWTD